MTDLVSGMLTAANFTIFPLSTSREQEAMAGNQNANSKLKGLQK